jgi:hypothetical protein
MCNANMQIHGWSLTNLEEISAIRIIRPIRVIRDKESQE